MRRHGDSGQSCAAPTTRLDAQGQVLDSRAAGFTPTQIRAHADLLLHHVLETPLGQPEFLGIDDAGGEARDTRCWITSAPPPITRHLHAERERPLKHVGESFPFTSGGRLLLAFDNHNSVNGIREFARARGASFEYARSRFPMRFDLPGCTSCSGSPTRRCEPLAFPAQSNFSGVSTLDLVDAAHAEGWRCCSTPPRSCRQPARSLVGQAGLRYGLVLEDVRLPTGVNCLLVRKNALPLLQRPWFAGGTVNFATVQGRAHILSPGEAIRDGTLNYLNIPAVEIGLRTSSCSASIRSPRACRRWADGSCRSCSICDMRTAGTWSASTGPRR